jgi:hypothetical protein
MPSSTNTDTKDTLVSTLERIESIDREIDALGLQIKELNKRRDSLEAVALEEMAAARMERGVPAGCRSWRIEWEHSFNLAKDRQAAVMDVLRAEGALEPLLSVNTSQLKSVLKDRAREAGKDARQPFTAGTAFDGLIGEFVRPVLRHTTVRRGGSDATGAPF